jgi:hypothetical protein
MTFFAVLIGAPAVAAAVSLCAIEVGRLVRPDWPLFGEKPPASLAEAISRGFSVEYAYVFIRNGQDPNEPIAVDNPDYDNGRSIKVSPVMLAVAARDRNVMLMLVNFGARLDLPQNRVARCLAEELGDTSIVLLFDRYGSREPGTPTCPDRKANAPTPLLRWVD